MANLQGADGKATRTQWDINFEAIKEPRTTHWDMDYLPSEQVAAAYNASNVSSAAAYSNETRRLDDGLVSQQTTNLLNFLLYQIGWFAVVLTAARGNPGLGMCTAFLLLLVHFVLSNAWKREFVLVVAGIFLGLIVDSTLVALGALRFPTEGWLPGLPPLWLSLMWAQFATTWNHSLSWLTRSRFFAALGGFVGGPLAFLAGEGLGAVSIGEPRWFALACLAAAWSSAIVITTVCVRWVAVKSRGPAGYRLR